MVKPAIAHPHSIHGMLPKWVSFNKAKISDRRMEFTMGSATTARGSQRLTRRSWVKRLAANMPIDFEVLASTLMFASIRVNNGSRLFGEATWRKCAGSVDDADDSENTRHHHPQYPIIFADSQRTLLANANPPARYDAA